MVNIRKFTLFAVCLSVLIVLASLSAACAETPADGAMIYIEASSPDQNGLVTVDVSAEHLEFLVYQIGLRYNPDALVPVNTENAQPASSFDEFAEAFPYNGLGSVGEQLDTEKHIVLFAGFASPGASGENIHDRMIRFEEKSPLYRFTFRKVSDADFGLAIATAHDDGPYSEIFPEGAIVTSTLEKSHVSGIRITYGDVLFEGETAAYFDSDINPAVFTKEDRLAGTVYLVPGDYASAVDGALKAIDPDDHEVVPYIRDDTFYYPLRFVAESLGATVAWDDAAGKASVISRDGRVTVINPESGTAESTGGSLQGGIELVRDRTMVTEDVLTQVLGTRYYHGGSYVVVYDSLVEWDADRQAEKEALDAMQYVFMPFFRMFL